MSKYDALWTYIAGRGQSNLKLSFAEIENIAGVPVDHSFLTYKKELLKFGYQVKKISMKARTIEFVQEGEAGENGV